MPQSDDRRLTFEQAARLIHHLTNGACAYLVLLTVDTEFRIDCLDSGQGVRERQVHTAPRRFQQRQPWVERHEHGASLLLPLLRGDDPVGMLEIAAESETQVESWDRSALIGIASLFALALDDHSARARIAELERFQRESAYLRDEIKAERDLRLLTGESPAMKAVRLAVQQVARTDSTVLILGETGAGKELVARAIHQLSARRNRLLVAVNCAALAPGVIASESRSRRSSTRTTCPRRGPRTFNSTPSG